MQIHGITTTELEAALGGSYTAPRDPDAPDPVAAPRPEPPAPGITVAELQAILGDLYTAPSLEDAA